MTVTLADFDWMAAADCVESLRAALKRLPSRAPRRDVYAALRDAKYLKQGHERGRAAARTRSIRAWGTRRAGMLRTLTKLERQLGQVYAADGRTRFALTARSTEKLLRGVFIDPDLLNGQRPVLEALAALKQAIADDPLLSAPLRQFRRGHPDEPWLAVGEKRLRAINGVTKDAALDLLRLTGLKPPEK